MINRKLYLEFITCEISPLLGSDDKRKRRIGVVKSALLHSWIEFMNDKKLDADHILEGGFELILHEAENWEKIENSMPDCYLRTYQIVMDAISGMIAATNERIKHASKN